MSNAFEYFLAEVSKKIIDYIYALGYFSEVTMLILTILLLYKDLPLLSVFFIGFILESYLNVYLKRFFKEERPKGRIFFLAAEMDGQHGAQFGMPSGHSELAFYAFSFMYFSIEKFTPLIWFSLLVAICSIYQRWAFHDHTLKQLLVGALVGSLFGFGVVKVGKQLLLQLK